MRHYLTDPQNIAIVLFAALMVVLCITALTSFINGLLKLFLKVCDYLKNKDALQAILPIVLSVVSIFMSIYLNGYAGIIWLWGIYFLYNFLMSLTN